MPKNTLFVKSLNVSDMISLPTRALYGCVNITALYCVEIGERKENYKRCVIFILEVLYCY